MELKYKKPFADEKEVQTGQFVSYNTSDQDKNLIDSYKQRIIELENKLIESDAKNFKMDLLIKSLYSVIEEITPEHPKSSDRNPFNKKNLENVRQKLVYSPKRSNSFIFLSEAKSSPESCFKSQRRLTTSSSKSKLSY
jgi:hypothetical protein